MYFRVHFYVADEKYSNHDNLCCLLEGRGDTYVTQIQEMTLQ